MVIRLKDLKKQNDWYARGYFHGHSTGIYDEIFAGSLKPEQLANYQEGFNDGVADKAAGIV